MRNNPPYEIRLYRHPEDYAAVVHLWGHAGPGIHVRRSDQPEEIAKKLQRDPDLFLVAQDGSQIVGTVLGGIWADQSWGRFWGWDPKENGALLIVLWCAAILHARRGGWIRERGLMNMAIFGNIVTAFSWFGVNMLGVGLHSYGFMEAGFKWIVIFAVSQVAIIALGLLPLNWWRSFRRDNAALPAGG